MDHEAWTSGNANNEISDCWIPSPLRAAPPIASYAVSGSSPPSPTGPCTRIFCQPSSYSRRSWTSAPPPQIGAASAPKTAQAVYQKASRALAGLAHALADHFGVADILTAKGKRYHRPILAEPDLLPTVAARAWRWSPEMTETAQALHTGSLPSTMIHGAAEVFDAWTACRDNPPDETETPFTLLRHMEGKPQRPAKHQENDNSSNA